MMDKYIGGRKVKKLGSSKQQIEEIQRQSISNIRSLASELQFIVNDISINSPSMISPSASPIKPKKRSEQSNNLSNLQQFIELKIPKDEVQEIKFKQKKQIKPIKHFSQVHFTNYMKPIGKLSEKIKEVLQEQQKKQEQQQIKIKQYMRSQKQKSTKFYKHVKPKYQTFEEDRVNRQQAIVYRNYQLQEKQMSEVTFSPVVNKNFQIKQPFETRLEMNKIKKMEKQSDILRKVMKNETYKPKLNSNNLAESKIKKIWNSSSSNKVGFNENSFTIGKTHTSHSHSNSRKYEDFQTNSEIKLNKISDFNFMIQQQ